MRQRQKEPVHPALATAIGATGAIIVLSLDISLWFAALLCAAIVALVGWSVKP